MPRQPKIRWTTSQREKLTSAVTKWNRALSRERSRLRKSGISPEGIIPAGLRQKALRKTIQSAKELNRLVQQLQRNLKIGVRTVTTEGGVDIPAYQLAELEEKVNKINRIRQKRKKKFNPRSETGTLGRIEDYDFQRKKSARTVSASNWSKFVESVEKQSKNDYWQSRDEMYKQSYINTLREVYGDNPIALKLIDMLNKISAEKIVGAMYEYPVLQLDFIYVEDFELFNAQIQAIYDSWVEYLNE